MRKNRKTILMVLLLGLVLLSGCGRRKEPAFAVFLISSEMTTEEALPVPLNELILRDAALLSMEDVVSYQPGIYELTLTDDAMGRLERVGIPLGGLPFVVVAQGERVYMGAFWTPISSMSYFGTAAMFSLDDDAATLRFDLGYPASPELFEGEDLRNDERILDAFAKAEKLIEQE